MTKQVCEDCYYGYDPDVMEPGPFEDVPSAPSDLPASFQLDQNTLPPVGDQGQAGDCFVWASAYGALTYKIASTTGVSAQDMSNQPAVGYTYTAYLSTQNPSPEPSCPGGQVGPFLTFLKGTPSESSVPTTSDTTCLDLWSVYNNSGTPTKDPRFQSPFLQMRFKTGSDLPEAARAGILDSIKTLLVQNKCPLIFGTSLYTDWPTYRPGPPVDGTPPVYVGKGPIWIGKNGKKVGHVMIIIGYDSTLAGGDGAFLIQNSSGSGWGTTWNGQGGYVWMDCNTFLTLAQGTLTILTD